jgi:hypothetical protein
MKKISLLILAFMIILQIGPVSSLAQGRDYEKYGRIAMAVVQADYPEKEVTDYEYKGRKTTGENQVVDDFLFTVVEKGKKRKVTVSVQHDLNNKKLVNLKVMEQERK